jgi:hypothetical protein
VHKIEVLLETLFCIHPLRGYCHPTKFGSDRAVVWNGANWFVNEWVRGLLLFSPCEPLLLEADSWGTGIFRESRVKGTSTVWSRYHTTTSKDTVDRQVLVSTEVNCRVYELAIALDLLVATISKWSNTFRKLNLFPFSGEGKTHTHSKGPNWVGIFSPSPEDGNRSRFRNVVCSLF